MTAGFVPPRVRSLPRLSYKSISDRKCRRRVRGCPRLLEKLLVKLTQTKDLYLLNMYSRGGLVSRYHVDQSLRVHRGRKWRVISPSVWHAGFTWGSLSRSRRVAAFKAKAANKKRKKVSKSGQLISEMRILQFRALQLGQKRRTSTRASVELEQQLRSLAP
jgi:ribosomal protein S19